MYIFYTIDDGARFESYLGNLLWISHFQNATERTFLFRNIPQSTLYACHDAILQSYLGKQDNKIFIIMEQISTNSFKYLFRSVFEYIKK